MDEQLEKRTQEADEDAEMREIIRKIITKGDLSGLSADQQLKYYKIMCARHNLDVMSKPFDFLETVDRKTGVKKIVLYGNKECAAQLRSDRGVSIYRLDESEENGIYRVTAYARAADGREDLDKGVTPVSGLSGESYSNAIKRAVTQAKRRVTLSICGLGMLDETEIDSIEGARRIEPPPAMEDQAEPKQVASGLDQWKCGRGLAMEIINLSTTLKARYKATDEVIRAWLPAGLTSRKELNEKEAIEFKENLSMRLRLNDICAALTARGVETETMREYLPGKQKALRDLTLPQTLDAITFFHKWLSALQREESEKQ